jgi:stage II sporulation protein D
MKSTAKSHAHMRGTLILIAILFGWAQGCGGSFPQRPSEITPDTFKKEPEITLYLHETGQTQSIMLEEYLLGVVAAEMDPAWPAEALSAQAILARTFTLERILSIGGVPQRGTDASTDVKEFQAYDESRITEAVKQAVQKTRGQVATHRQKLIKAWFFADAGGITAASAVEGLAYDKEPAPYVHSVEDPGWAITLDENKAWEAAFSLEEIREKVTGVNGWDPGPISAISVKERGPSGRVTKFQVNQATVGGPALRLALGGEKLRSMLISDISVLDGYVTLAGKGYGHGVGMSQWGARGMAEQGKTSQEIIRYFFEDVDIHQQYQ